jgi:tetratricopeptide (TPR) repeat protein
VGASSSAGVIAVDDADPRLFTIDELGVCGRLLDALGQLEAIASIEQLRGTRARCMAGWLLEHLGDRRAALRLHTAEHRANPEHPTARYFRSYDVMRQRGPVEAWLLLRDYEPPARSTAFERAEIAGQKARVLALLGDRRGAAAELERCDPAVLGEPRMIWLRATLLEESERRDEARELVEDALQRHGHHRLLVQHFAVLLEADNRHERALELLSRAASELQAPVLCSQLASLEHELGRYQDELATLVRFEELSVKAGPELRRELAFRRAENAYARGAMRDAARFGREASEEYRSYWLDKLPAADGPPDRKLLSLPVLLQEPMGCAPSSLAILSSYFGVPVDHVDVADQICYEGTASHSERSWVEARGFVSREFTVDFETAQALIERDVPFLLVTVAVASAHAQVVVGFDRTRRSLLIRDPGGTRIVELAADKLFERHRAYGPRGHVMLPPELAPRLEGLTLPETAIHDAAHALRLAISSNVGTAIDAGMAALEALAPHHPLTLWARRSIAVLNGDPYAILACSEALLERFPEDANAELSVLDCLANIGTRAELEARVQKRLRDPKASWIFHERWAELLLSDAEQLASARASLRRAERIVPTRGRTLSLRAFLERNAGNLAVSLCLRRAAATLEPTDDELARAYFEEAFRQGMPEPALALLRDRVERYQERSGQPLCVLFTALEWLDREHEAFLALEAGLAARPDDGPLALFAAEVYARYGQQERAFALLERAKGTVPLERHEQAAAALAELSGDLAGALARHEAVLVEQPFSPHSNEAVATLRSELYGLESAREYLEQACRRFPTHCDLRERYIRFLRGHDPEHVLPELDALLALQPSHGWALRERALVLSDLGRHAEAIAQAELAEQRQPNHPASPRVLAAVLAATGRREAALGPARRALELFADGSGNVSDFLGLAGSLREQLDLMSETFELLAQRSTTGGGLFEWREYAAGLLRPETLHEKARRLVAARPGSWVSHQFLARERMLCGDGAGARSVLSETSARFPFVTRLFLDLAAVCRALGDTAGEAAAVASALRIDPSSVSATLRAAQCVEQQRDPSLAKHTLERGLRFHPRSVDLLLALAELAFDAGDPETALEKARLAVECDPESGPAWSAYAQYASHLGRGERVTELAEELTRKRPWNAFIWLRLADVRRLEGENQLGIEALRQALERRPQLSEALDIYAQALTRIGKKDEALEACERPLTNYFARGALRARRAWVLWEFGEREQACLEMRKVLADHTDQLWGLQELISWEEERGQIESALRLAEELVARAPLRAVSYGFLGSAQLAAKDVDAALRSFEQAAKLDPSYAYAGTRRVEHALARRRFEDAERVIEEQGPHVPAGTREFWSLSLACGREDTERAMSVLRRIAVNPSASSSSISACLEPLSRLQQRELARGLYPLVSDPEVHPELGAVWVSLLFGTRFSVSALRIARVRRSHPAAFEAAARAHFEHLGESSGTGTRLTWSVLLLGLAARGNDELWGKVGYALASAHAYVFAELWLAGYARRPATEAWMLHNYRVCALENHRPQAGLRAAERALALPTDVTLPKHLAFVAFGRAANGDIEGAREILEGRAAMNLTGLEQQLFDAARLLVELASTPDDARPELLRELGRVRLTAHAGGQLAPTSFTTLQRWLASGVLRQHFSLYFLLVRWQAPLASAALVALVVLAPFGSELLKGIVTMIVATSFVYYLARRTSS